MPRPSGISRLFLARSTHTHSAGGGMGPIRLTPCDVTGALRLLIGRLTHYRGNKSQATRSLGFQSGDLSAWSGSL